MQIIETRTNFIRVDKSCWSDSFRESRSCLIEQGTGLKVEQIIQQKNKKERYLKLTGKSGHFYLKESTNIKMTEVPDTTTNTLRQLKMSTECPFWVRLECATDNTIVFSDPYHRRRTHQMLTDPMQVVQFSWMTFVVAWTVAENDMVQCAIVPPNVFNVQKLEIQPYPTKRLKRMASIRDPMIIRTGLYMIPLSFSELIWIQKAQPTLTGFVHYFVFFRCLKLRNQLYTYGSSYHNSWQNKGFDRRIFEFPQTCKHMYVINSKELYSISKYSNMVKALNSSHC